MRYSIAKALVYSLIQDEYFKSISIVDKEYIINKILDDVKGRMLEDIVLLETQKSSSRDTETFKFKFDLGGEYDMVVCDKATLTSKIFEIKHSDKIVEQQTRFLRDDEKCALIEHRFGTIGGKYVLYRGKTTRADGIQYLNVEEYLNSLS